MFRLNKRQINDSKMIKLSKLNLPEEEQEEKNLFVTTIQLKAIKQRTKTPE